MGRAVRERLREKRSGGEQLVMKKQLATVLDYYREFGFDALPFRLEKRRAVPVLSPREPCDEATPAGNSDACTGRDAALLALRGKIGDCTLCKLSGGRTHMVFGEGSPDADIMFIGEAPGREEDAQGRPFVGDAGQLLSSMIEKMGLKRSGVYIANIVKCRPPDNRDPEADEMVACFPFLNEQIRIIAPRIIVSLGRIATYNLMKPAQPITKFSIMRERGKWFQYQDVPVMPTFHPAYLMRNRKDKWLTWSDMQAVLARLDELKTKDGIAR
ncbi:MAG: DNA polymerase bacteriophage-type [Nitrospirae bacterium]|nr:MAG: DNA polymerase bacteriophage-type [Nitrospirota bacterium]